MVDLTQLRNFPLKVIFLVHFFLLTLATTGYWIPLSYLFYNSVILALVFWGLVSDLEDPIQLALVINGFSIILDIFTLSFHFPSSYGFGAVMAILFLIVKPFTCIQLAKIIRERIGVTGPISGIGDIFPPPRNTSYEDIDRNAPAAQPNHGYDYSSAQQI